MSKTKISEYSATANSNTDVGGINIDEGCAPSGINDAIRTLMAQLKNFQTGASGDSFNGPVGTTTAAAGAFTTLSASGVATFSAGSASAPALTTSGDTNTGVLFPAADTVCITTGGTERVRVDSSGNVGLGVSPSAWGSSFKVLEFGGGNSFYSAGDRAALSANSYYNGSAWTYKATGGASRYEMVNNQASWYTAGSGSAGASISFTQAMTLDSSGNLGLGVSPSAWGSPFKAIDVTAYASFAGTSTGAAVMLQNAYYNGTNYVYKNSDYALRYSQGSGIHSWSTAASGTAGNTISFTQAMTLDASGRWMVGNTTGESKANVFCGGSNGFTSGTLPPGMTIYGSTNDGYGSMLSFKANNGAQGVAGIGSFRVSGYQTDLRFYTNDTNNGDAFSERARIDSDGRWLVNATSAASSATKAQISYNPSADYGLVLYPTNTTYNNSSIVFLNNSSTAVGYIYSTGSATTYSTTSDYRLKENIAPMTGALEKVAALKPCTYTWKADGSVSQGFIAHELQVVVPEAVVGEKDAVDEDGNIKPQGIDTSFLVATLTAAIQELNEKFEAYKATHP